MGIATFDPPTLDPHRLKESTGTRLAMDLFCGLVARDPRGNPIPGVAKRWETSADQTTWTFYLRQGLTWSDGHAFGAEDIVWSFRRALDPSTGNLQASMLYPIAGAEAFNKGDAEDPETLGVRALGPDTVEIRLARPYARMLPLMATAYALPVPRHAIEAFGDSWTDAGKWVGNGAFVLAERRHAERLVLRKNPRFYDAATVGMDTITLYVTTDSQAGYQWYQTEKLDWTQQLVPSAVVQAKMAANAPELRVYDFAGVFMLFMNAEKAPFDNVKVRKALDLALDRGRLTRQVLKAGQRPAHSIIPPAVTGARPKRRRWHDVDTARRLLVEAGYGPNGQPLPTLELIYNTNEANKQVAEFLQRNLKEALGVEVEVRNLDWKTYLERLGSPDYMLGQIAMGGFDAYDFGGLLKSDHPDNKARWKNAAYDAALKAVREAPTPAAEDQAVSALMAILDREMPIIPLYVMTRSTLLRPGISGFEATYDGYHPLRWLRWRTP